MMASARQSLLITTDQKAVRLNSAGGIRDSLHRQRRGYYDKNQVLSTMQRGNRGIGQRSLHTNSTWQSQSRSLHLPASKY